MISISLNKTIEQKFNKLLNLYHGKYDELIDGMFEYKKMDLEKGISNLENDLKMYERKYNISSSEFYKKFTNAEYIEHKDDYIKWSGEYELLNDLKSELAQIS